MSERFIILEDGTIFDTFNEVKYDTLEILAELEWYIDEYRNLEKKLKANQNQKAIECLMKVKENCEKVGKFGFLKILTDKEFDETYIGEYVDHLIIKEIIDNKIKELEKSDGIYRNE